MMTCTVGERLPIEYSYLTPDNYLALSAHEESPILAAIVHGAFDPPPAAWPQIRSHLKPLGQAACVEVWHCRQPMTYSEDDGFQVALANDFLFAGAHLPEGSGRGLASLAEEIYLKALGLAERLGYPHLLRMWNLIPAINGDQHGIERYKLFCVGRYDAVARQAPRIIGRYPSASAVGTHEGGLSLYFLAAKSAGVPVENPKQVSAYHYPPRYGPRSPSFSRALVKHWAQSTDLFISGTASVFGHESRYPYETLKQTKESLKNVRALIDRAESVAGIEFPLRGPNVLLKAFIRNPDDFPEVRAILERQLGSDARLLCVEADICRSELMFELEGTISVPPSRSGDV